VHVHVRVRVLVLAIDHFCLLIDVLLLLILCFCFCFQSVLCTIVSRPGISFSSLFQCFPLFSPFELCHLLNTLEYDQRIRYQDKTIEPCTLRPNKRIKLSCNTNEREFQFEFEPMFSITASKPTQRQRYYFPTIQALT
jgi:hypothetical protein